MGSCIGKLNSQVPAPAVTRAQEHPTNMYRLGSSSNPASASPASQNRSNIFSRDLPRVRGNSSQRSLASAHPIPSALSDQPSEIPEAVVVVESSVVQAVQSVSLPDAIAAARARVEQAVQELQELLALQPSQVQAPLSRMPQMRIPQPDQHNYPALHLAALNGTVDDVHALLDGGANIEALSPDGFPVLHLAVHERKTELVNALLDRGADIQARSADGYPVLHRAVALRSLDVVNVLLRRGADTEAVVPFLPESHSNHHAGTSQVPQ